MRQLVYTETRELTGFRKTYDVFRFYFWWYVNYWICRIWFGLDIEGSEHIPTDGRGVLVSNHLSFLDANIISAASPRKVSFMIAKEYYEMTAIRWMCEFLGCIPVNRSGEDIAAVKGAIKKLNKDFLLGAFPEGGISRTGEMEDPKQGIAMIALRTESPVVPVLLSGYRYQTMLATFLLPKKIRIKIGPPLDFSGENSKDRESLERVTNRIAQSIQELREL
ncbi:MAG: 1-acyl-sn-glycerol-3-phosphate acyltransferase [Candidatus Omnitrophica bacterium]|nr:1-acyl-sn-glycerol-3-phosphate acyltransferase [Candidatus Omnitrophota bacterium]MCB9770746.1 1-acyl-sn-glycerol-3-phosphate acyltransferase [Candidatus Omnitrophota bacterium]MCB9783843.1 1-acyl-sn-glycerol-3-phosphate acyltransferase [Candidatus Omnitrophota bacterium]